MTANKRRHINILDKGECLCCGGGNADTTEHIIKYCKRFETDQMNISGRDGGEGSENDEIRSLLGLNGDLVAEDLERRAK